MNNKDKQLVLINPTVSVHHIWQELAVIRCISERKMLKFGADDFC